MLKKTMLNMVVGESSSTPTVAFAPYSRTNECRLCGAIVDWVLLSKDKELTEAQLMEQLTVPASIAIYDLIIYNRNVRKKVAELQIKLGQAGKLIKAKNETISNFENNLAAFSKAEEALNNKLAKAKKATEDQLVELEETKLAIDKELIASDEYDEAWRNHPYAGITI